MSGDLRTRVRRIVERDIAASADTRSLLHADILALLDADPDTPTTEHEVDAVDLRKWLAGETARALPQLNGFEVADALLPYVLERLSLEYAEGFAAGSRPDAPVDDGLVEQIARIIAEALDDPDAFGIDRESDPEMWERNEEDRDYWRKPARALVVARPWQAEVEAARQDTLNKAADDLDEFAATVYATDIFITPTKEQYAEINALLKRERGHQLDGVAADCYRRAITVQANRLREMAADIDDDLQAARGETRQP